MYEIVSYHFKEGRIPLCDYLHFESANAALFQFIEGWYNRRRIHGQLNYQTPQEVEDQYHQSS
ncbi:IS3 family transposase [Niallia nealsonii]|uniref:IS3 family transposase n=1 Tax=Niallia nealsonii TaxID=115979 RepID=UPI0038B2B93D